MNESRRDQNKIIQLIQNIALTISTIALLLITLKFSGIVDGVWEDVSSVQGPVDDVVGYAMLVNGAAGILGSFLIVVMFILLIVLAVGTVFFWVMFGLAYSKNASTKRYCTCTSIDAGVKTVLMGGCVIATIGDALKELLINGTEAFVTKVSANINIGNLLWLLCLAGSIKVLWNSYKMKKDL